MPAKFLQQILLVAAGLLAAGGAGRAAVPSSSSDTNDSGHFQQSFYYPGQYYNQKQMDIFGNADPSSVQRSNLVIRNIKINTYRLLTNDFPRVTNSLEMIMEAPECVVNGDARRGSSPGHLTVRTGDDRFLIEGDGYLWQQADTNATLTISNNVVTTVNADFLATNSGLGAPSSSAKTNRVIRIHADRFFFDRSANLVSYTGHVHAEDEQLDLTCDTVNLHRSTTGVINDLVADGNIVIVDKTNGGRTTGDHAVYSAADGGQLVTLTGHPHWQSGPGEATADAFIFDRMQNTYRAQGNAHLTLPSKFLTDANFLRGPQPSAATNSPDASPDLVTITADSITLRLPQTNSPFRSFKAEKNVVIVDAGQDSGSTSDEAEYADATGILELNGHANSHFGNRLVRGDTITFDRNQKTLTVLTNAYLKMPVAALGPATNLGGAALKVGTTNLFLEVTAGTYKFTEEELDFREVVHANGLDGETLLGTLDCGALTVAVRSNSPQSILAETNVLIHRLPATDARGRTIEQNLNCDRLFAVMRTNGFLVESVTASGQVKAWGTEISRSNATPVKSSISAGTFTATFLPDTNVDTAVAEQNVVLTRNEVTGRGDKLVYAAVNDTFTLTGKPEFERPNFQIASEDAIIYEKTLGMVRAKGSPREDFVIRLGRTNNAFLPGVPIKAK